MSLAGHFIHLATFQRDMGTTDAYGVQASVWNDLPPIPCRLVEKLSRVMNDERTEIANVVTYLLLVSPDADVDDAMRVSKVTVEDGSEVLGPFTISAIVKRRSRHAYHQSLALQRVD
jgi:hypothetical protein